MSKTSKLFECPHCDYSTPRKYNLILHLNRKKSCKPKKDESINAEIVPNVVSDSQSVVSDSQSVVSDSQNVVLDTGNVVLDTGNVVCNSQASETKKYECGNCGKPFANRQNRYRHMKDCKVEKTPSECNPDAIKDFEIEELKSKIRRLESTGTGPHIINNNTYHITTNNDNSIINTNNNTINYNNFDSPSLSHITSQMIGDLYIKSDRELPRMIGKAVREIYRIPENDTIRFKYGNQAGFAEVRQDDETRILPVSDVLETVLSQASTLCGKELMKCCGDDIGQIPGPNVISHANELAVLHWGFVPETHAARQGFFKFVKSALL